MLVIRYFSTHPEISRMVTAAGAAGWQITQIVEDGQPERWTFTNPSGTVKLVLTDVMEAGIAQLREDLRTLGVNI